MFISRESKVIINYVIKSNGKMLLYRNIIHGPNGIILFYLYIIGYIIKHFPHFSAIVVTCRRRRVNNTFQNMKLDEYPSFQSKINI